MRKARARTALTWPVDRAHCRSTAFQAIPTFSHSYPFDPSYGYDLDSLLKVEPPEAPADFASYWRRRHERARRIDPGARFDGEAKNRDHWQIRRLSYRSTDDFEVRGWALVPRHEPVRRGFLALHGYGGIEGPDMGLPFRDAAIFFPCLRGISLSARPDIPADPQRHVLHGIEDRDRYVHGQCVEDVWTGVSALQQLFPQVEARVGMLGVSFGGGIGTLALPWDDRIARAHFEVPSFGNHPLRLTLPTAGSGAAVIEYEHRTGRALQTLQYYDAAAAARFARSPVQIAAALFDPCVAPPGQFSIYNALREPRRLFVLQAGHYEYPGQDLQRTELIEALKAFFSGI